MGYNFFFQQKLRSLICVFFWSLVGHMYRNTTDKINKLIRTKAPFFGNSVECLVGFTNTTHVLRLSCFSHRSSKTKSFAVPQKNYILPLSCSYIFFSGSTDTRIFLTKIPLGKMCYLLFQAGCVYTRKHICASR